MRQKRFWPVSEEAWEERETAWPKLHIAGTFPCHVQCWPSRSLLAAVAYTMQTCY